MEFCFSNTLLYFTRLKLLMIHESYKPHWYCTNRRLKAWPQLTMLLQGKHRNYVTNLVEQLIEQVGRRIMFFSFFFFLFPKNIV